MTSARVRGGKITSFFLRSDDCTGGRDRHLFKVDETAHRDVRQEAVFVLGCERYRLVEEALHERKIFLQTALYLSNTLPITLPRLVGVSRQISCFVATNLLGADIGGSHNPRWMQGARFARGEREPGDFVSPKGERSKPPRSRP
jgi:hypothetical protein